MDWATTVLLMGVVYLLAVVLSGYELRRRRIAPQVQAVVIGAIQVAFIALTLSMFEQLRSADYLFAMILVLIVSSVAIFKSPRPV